MLSHKKLRNLDFSAAALGQSWSLKGLSAGLPNTLGFSLNPTRKISEREREGDREREIVREIAVQCLFEPMCLLVRFKSVSSQVVGAIFFCMRWELKETVLDIACCYISHTD